MVAPLFPTLPGLGFPVKRTPKWPVNKQDALSGKRVRTSYQTYPVYQWDLILNFLRSDAVNIEEQTLIGFINSLAGGTGLFQYNETSDNSATTQVFGTGDGSSTTFQLVRSYGGFVEPVFLPVLSGGFVTQVRVNGVPTVAYTVSATGQIIFTSAPALSASLDWTGTFNWPCRFDDDVFDLSQDFALIWSMKSLKFSSEKLP